MSKMTTATTAKGYTITRREVGTWGRPEVVFEAHEPSALMGPHGSITSLEGKWFGSLASRRLPKEIEVLPQGQERWSACDAFRKANYDESYAAIAEAFPEAGDGDRSMGSIRIEGKQQ